MMFFLDAVTSDSLIKDINPHLDFYKIPFVTVSLVKSALHIKQLLELNVLLRCMATPSSDSVPHQRYLYLKRYPFLECNGSSFLVL